DGRAVRLAEGGDRQKLAAGVAAPDGPRAGPDAWKMQGSHIGALLAAVRQAVERCRGNGCAAVAGKAGSYEKRPAGRTERSAEASRPMPWWPVPEGPAPVAQARAGAGKTSARGSGAGRSEERRVGKEWR